MCGSLRLAPIILALLHSLTFYHVWLIRGSIEYIQCILCQTNGTDGFAKGTYHQLAIIWKNRKRKVEFKLRGQICCKTHGNFFINTCNKKEVHGESATIYHSVHCQYYTSNAFFRQCSCVNLKISTACHSPQTLPSFNTDLVTLVVHCHYIMSQLI